MSRRQKKAKIVESQGQVQKNPRGFAFVIPEDPKLPDAYIDRKQAKDLLSRDKILFRYSKHRGKVSASVIKILERGLKTVMGQIERYGHRLVLVTENGEFAIEAAGGPVLSPGDWITGDITKYPSGRHGGCIKVKDYFGQELGPEHDYDIAISRFSLPSEFSTKVLNESETSRELITEKELSKRKNLEQLPLVTVDGEDAKDFDDAVAVTRGERGSYTLYVAIADVSHFVRPGSALDKAAARRGTSVYLPGFCLPMLPKNISNDLCSLRPKQLRLAFTAEIHFDRQGQLQKTEFYQSVIRTHARITYTELQDFFERRAGAKEKFTSLEKPLKDMYSLFKVLKGNRKSRGTIDFDLPECEIEIDQSGVPTECRRARRFDSHQLIEEFMIAANRAVAKKLKDSNSKGLFRVHEAPSTDSLDEINQNLKYLGVSQRLKQLTPKAFSQILAACDKVQGGKTMHTVILRCQKQARYHHEPLGHFGLALKDYTHFTSPIRRYPDLVVHRILKRLITEAKPTDKKYEEAQLAEIGTLTSQQERTAMEAERFAVKRKQCWYLSSRIGERWQGEVKWVNPDGMFVELTKLALEGFLPTETLKGFFEYDSRRMALVQRPGRRRIQVGSQIEIVIDEVSIEEGKIWFSEA